MRQVVLDKELRCSDFACIEIFIDLLDDESLTQSVHFPTFKQADDTLKNTLDYIISDTPERIQELSGHGPLGIAKQGHLSLTWNFQLAKPLRKIKNSSIKFQLKHGQYTKINEMFEEIDWNKLLQNKSVNTCYSIFQDKYNDACEKFIPKKSNRLTKQRAPWMNKNLMDIVKKKKNLWHQNMSANWKCSQLSDEYRTINRNITKLTRDTVRKFEENLASDKKTLKSFTHT